MSSFAAWGFRPLILTIFMFAATAVNAQDFTANWSRVSDETLDTVRGGFQETNGGIERFISFGITRAVFINGKMVTSALDSPGVSVTPSAAVTMNSVQTIGGQTVFPGGTQVTPGLMTIIQNTLDNQLIQNRTIINATVSALGSARSAAFGAAVQHAVASVIGR